MVGNSQVIFEKVENSSLTLVGMFFNSVVLLKVKYHEYFKITPGPLYF